MSLCVIRGLILKEVHVGESDKILTVLAKGLGKMFVSAKGARRTKSPLYSASAFTYADLTVRIGKKHRFLTAVDTINTFYYLTKDIEALACASCILELADKITAEDMPSDKTLFLTLHTLKRLCDHRLDPRLALPLCELKFLQYHGFAPELDICVRCGAEHNGFMSPYGTLCKKCAASAANSAAVSDTVIYTMRHILANEPPQLFGFGLEDSCIQTLSRIVSDMTQTHFEVELKSKKFIDSLNMG